MAGEKLRWHFTFADALALLRPGFVRVPARCLALCVLARVHGVALFVGVAVRFRVAPVGFFMLPGLVGLRGLRWPGGLRGLRGLRGLVIVGLLDDRTKPWG